MANAKDGDDGTVASDRRGFMKVAGLGAAAGVAGKFSLAPVSSAVAQEATPDAWWPSKWGPEIGQVGTQLDGLGHIGLQLGEDGDKREMRYYNGFTELETGNAYGLLKLGVEKLKPIVTKAHLIDAAGLKGGMMDVGQEITLQDVRDALDRQEMSEDDIEPGDAVLFHTGWGSLWMENNDRFNSGCPGIGMEVAEWVVEKDLGLVGGDTWPTEVIPNPDPEVAFPVHAHLLTKHGIVNHENLFFDEVIADGKFRFVYMFTAMPIKGATGSAGCPIAIS